VARARETLQTRTPALSAERVAVVGLGGMGSRIAGRLVAGGHDVLVWNRTAAKAAPLLALGARAAPTPSAAAREAEAEGADYVVFGPVFETASHPGQPATGLERLREVALAVEIPVLAIGGIDETTAELCRHAGAAGFAAIRYFS
jgi:shikimate 5-dehydrogenase